MASFIFEEGDQLAASGFTAGDTLYFKTAAPADVNVVYTAATGLSVAKVTLTYGDQTLEFAASAIGNAEDIVFIAANGELVLGTPDADTGETALGIASDADSAVYGFAGNDTITVSGATIDEEEVSGNHIAYGGAGNDTITVTGGGFNNIFGEAGNDVLNGGAATDDGSLNMFGGAGEDTIIGGAGNDHLYGQSAAGGSDDGDSIDGGAGNDYIQGNAGDDVLVGGAGSDRINGGADNDDITGGEGNDTVNGNKGDDVIDGGLGNDSLRGGAGDDEISGSAGNDVILGDLGDDTISGGDGSDVLTGGEGADVFVFGAADASGVTLGTGSAAKDYYDTITDFTAGEDKIELAFAIDEDDGVLLQSSGVSFTTFSAAQTYAQQLLVDDGADDGSIAAIQVGGDTYLFYSADGTYTAGADVDQFVLLQGVTAADLSVDDFTATVAV